MSTETINISEATATSNTDREAPVPNSIFNDAFAGLVAVADVPEGASRSGSTAPKETSSPSPTAKPTSTPAPATTKPATAAPDASQSGKPESTDPKSSVAPATSKQPEKAPDKPAEEPAVDKMAPKQLREVYAKTRARVKELESKLSEPNGKPAADDPEKKSLQEKLTAREQELNSIQEQLRLADYEKHPDYKKNYWEPFVEKFNEGRQLVKSMTVKDGEGNDRQGTEADFDALMRMSDPNALAETVEAMFGPIKGAEVMAARREVIARNNARSKALDDHRALTAKNAEQTEAQIKQHRETWQRLNTEAAEKFPQWFKPTEGESKDDKANELLQKGMALADYAFSGQVKPEEMVPLHSAIRNKAGGFDRLVYENQKLSKELEELRKWKSEVEASSPSGGTIRRGAAPQSDEATMEGAMNRLNSLAG